MKKKRISPTAESFVKNEADRPVPKLFTLEKTAPRFCHPTIRLMGEIPIRWVGKILQGPMLRTKQLRSLRTKQLRSYSSVIKQQKASKAKRRNPAIERRNFNDSVDLIDFYEMFSNVTSDIEPHSKLIDNTSQASQVDEQGGLLSDPVKELIKRIKDRPDLAEACLLFLDKDVTRPEYAALSAELTQARFEKTREVERIKKQNYRIRKRQGGATTLGG